LASPDGELAISRRSPARDPQPRPSLLPGSACQREGVRARTRLRWTVALGHNPALQTSTLDMTPRMVGHRKRKRQSRRPTGMLGRKPARRPRRTGHQPQEEPKTRGWAGTRGSQRVSRPAQLELLARAQSDAQIRGVLSASLSPGRRVRVVDERDPRPALYTLPQVVDSSTGASMCTCTCGRCIRPDRSARAPMHML